MKQQNSFQQEQERSRITVDPGVERMIMGYDENLMMVKVKFEKNAVGALHFHQHLQTAYIAKGSFEVTIDGKTSLPCEGDAFL